MEQTLERMTATRFKLEEKYFHVTFLRTNEKNGYTYWNVSRKKLNGYNEFTVGVSPAWEIDHLIAEIEVRLIKPKGTKRLSDEKLKAYFECMARGILLTDHRYYTRYTLKKLNELLENHRAQ